MLDFSLSGPTCYAFVQYYLTYFKPAISTKDNKNDYQCLDILTSYLCTLSLLRDRPFSSYRSSMIAASSLVYANQLLNNNTNWTNRYIQITSYNKHDLNECISALEKLYTETFHQDKTTSSILRRYLRNKKDNENYQCRVKEIIHETFDDEVIDNKSDEENCNMEYY